MMTLNELERKGKRGGKKKKKKKHRESNPSLSVYNDEGLLEKQDKEPFEDDESDSDELLLNSEEVWSLK